MQVIIDFIAGIGDMLASLFGFVIDFVGDIVYIVTLIAKVVVALPSYFTWLPAPVSALLLTILSIVAVYKITGREG